METKQPDYSIDRSAENIAEKKLSILGSDPPIEAAEMAPPVKPGDQVVVLYDECGDTLWDAVLAQEEKDTRPQQEKNGVL